MGIAALLLVLAFGVQVWWFQRETPTERRLAEAAAAVRRGAGGKEALVHPEPRLDSRVGRAVHRLFAALSASRGARIFHPSGLAYRARFESLPTAAPARATVFERGFEHEALVRFSRGLGLPRPLPDFLGLALRLPDVYGAGRHQDLLLATTGPRPLGNALPLPASTFFGRAFSSLLPHAVGPRTLLVGAFALDGAETEEGELEPLAELEETLARSEVRFAVALAGATTPWRPVALLTVGGRLSDAEAAALRFNPWNTGGGLEPAWRVNALRDPAYRGSQAGRQAPAA